MLGLIALASSLLLILAPRLGAQPIGEDDAQDFFQTVLRADTNGALQILHANTNLARVPAAKSSAGNHLACGAFNSRSRRQHLRAAIIAIARETPLKVLVCPEDQSQMAVGKRWVEDKLPADVRERVVWRERFWLTDEDLSTYVRSAGLFGLEMHSPSMCIGNGMHAIGCRCTEQTSKGIMWRDIGLGDWLFDFDVEEEIKRLVPAVLRMVNDPAAAKAKVANARAFVEQRQRATMAELRKHSRS